MKEKKLMTFLLGTLIALGIMLPNILEHGGYLLLWGDYNLGQIPFYVAFHDAIRSGSLLWNSNIDLGVDLIGATAFSLGSPFLWVTFLFPLEAMVYLIGPLLAIKIGFAALAGYVYIRRFVTKPTMAMLSALLYVFSGFSITNLWWNHFFEPLILFPLLLLALDRLVLERKKGLFLVLVFFSAFVNFFFFIGSSVFLIIYFIINTMTGRYKINGKILVQIAFETIVGMMTSAIILIPAVLASLGSGRAGVDIDFYSAFLYPNDAIRHLLASMIYPPEIQGLLVLTPNGFPWASVSLFLPVFGITGVLAFFTIREKKLKPIRWILLVSLVFALVPLLNSSFTLFTGHYYARWFYMPILFMALATGIALDNFERGKWKGTLAVVGIITMVSSLLIWWIPNIGPVGWQRGIYDHDYPFRALSMLLIGVGSAVLSFLMVWVRKYREQWFPWVSITVIGFFSIFYGINFIQQGTVLYPVPLDSRNSDNLIRYRSELLEDTGFYRIDYADPYSNLSLILNKPGIKSFTNVISSSVLPLYESLGNPRTGVVTTQDVTQVAYRSLMSVKYYIADGTSDIPVEGFVYQKSLDDYSVYENSNYIPFGFAYNSYITEEQYMELPVEARDLALLKALVLDQKQIDHYSGLVSPLGEEELKEDTDEALRRTVQQKQSQASDLVQTGKNSITVGIALEEPGLVFFSIPYKSGWKATVNGDPVPVEDVSYGLVAIEAPEGENRIKLVYDPLETKIALAVTILGTVVMAGYFLFPKIWSLKR